MSGTLPPLTPSQLALIPLESPPPGQVSNFQDPGVDGNLRPTVVGLNSFFTFITLVFISLRLYSRLRVSRSFGYDDVAAIIAEIAALAMYASGVAGAYYKYQTEYVHTWNVSLWAELETVQFWFTLEWTYFIELFASKMAVTTLYLRLFAPKPRIRMAIWGATALAFSNLVVGIAGVFGIARSYDKTTLLFNLANTRPIVVATAAINLAVDLVLFAIPIFAISSLHMATSRKIGIGSVFATGLLAVLASTLSIYYRVVDLYTADTAWNYTPLSILCFFEIAATIVVSCMPSIPALMQADFMKSRIVSDTRSWLKSSIPSFSRTERSGSTGKSTKASQETNSTDSASLDEKERDTFTRLAATHGFTDLDVENGPRE